MKAKEAEIIIDVCLKAVNEQYIMPMMMAMGTLTAAICRDPVMAEAVSAILREQAETCPEGVSGRILLQALAGLAAAPAPPDPASVQDALRASLRLIQGGRNQPKKD